ncbi:diguanylate cyclase domain-containing protein [Deinococcus lacus]|uniref:Diguanylate cyclase domain-containing protein n=1 Tax=Deinococcus lacus TaxID=392561 RepID=A0ABW1YC61_9DEIO
MARPEVLSEPALAGAAAELGAAPFCLAVVNVDHYSEVAALGRNEGERLLGGLERQLAGQLPGGGRLARLGRDEYALLLPETSPETALRLLDGIVRDFHRHRDPRWPRSAGLSAGIAARPAHAATYGELRRAAEEALARAKREGKGRACLYAPGRMVLKSNYYSRSQLERLKRCAQREGRSEAEILRDALAAYLQRWEP